MAVKAGPVWPHDELGREETGLRQQFGMNENNENTIVWPMKRRRRKTHFDEDKVNVYSPTFTLR